jgi:hypothetical protein
MDHAEISSLLQYVQSQLDRVSHRLIHLPADATWGQRRDLASTVQTAAMMLERVRGEVEADSPVAVATGTDPSDSVALLALSDALRSFVGDLGRLVEEFPRA